MSGPIVLDNGVLQVSVSPRGGAILDGLTDDGRPFLRSYGKTSSSFDVKRTACFPLVPICNRVEGNRFDFAGRSYAFEPNTDDPLYLHGDGWLENWSVDRKTLTETQLSFARTVSEKSPYEYHAEQTVRLDGSTLCLDLSVTNRGDGPLPFGIGFHPYFPRTADVRLHAPARDWWAEGPGHLPTHREAVPSEADFSSLTQLPSRWLNNCYEGWSRRAQIVWPRSNLMVEIEAGALFSRYMLYAPDDDPSFFCLEPMSHTPNALATSEPLGLQVLNPGQTLAGGFTISVSKWNEPHE